MKSSGLLFSEDEYETVGSLHVGGRGIRSLNWANKGEARGQVNACMHAHTVPN